MKTNTSALEVKGCWQFNKTTSSFAEISGNNNTLIEGNNSLTIPDTDLSGVVRLDGSSQYLQTKKAVLDTESSYSVAALVRIDSAAVNNKLELKAEVGECALTAVSQDSSTHSAFYLGIRKIDEQQSEGGYTSSLRWNFTIAPIDGSETGAVEWKHVYTKTPLDDSMLDKWFFLVGVCDVHKKKSSIYVPTINESDTTHIPNELKFLPSKNGIKIGAGKWLGKNVDYWPGSIAMVKVFSGVLTAEDVNKLYSEYKI